MGRGEDTQAGNLINQVHCLVAGRLAPSGFVFNNIGMSPKKYWEISFLHEPARWFMQSGIIILLVFLAYLPALQGAFIWDDDSWTTGIIALLRDGSGLRTMWFHLTALQQYYQLTGTTFWIDYHLWGFWTLPYHVENVLLHSLAALLFWRLLLRLQVPGAWLASAVFALHPVMVESVAWITERKNVLSMVLYLGALLAYGHYAQWATSTGKIKPIADRSCGIRHLSFFYGLALVLFLGALLAKTTSFSLPAVILLIGWWKGGQIRWREDVFPALPFFAFSISLCLVTAWLEKNHVGAKGSDFVLTFPERFLIAGHVFWFYIGKLLWPVNLCFLYPRWQLNTNVWWQWLYPITAVCALCMIWLARRHVGRGPVAAVFFYVGTLFPVLGFMNAYFMRFSFVCDHWTYLSSLGLIALGVALVAGVAERFRTQWILYGFAAVVLPMLLLMTRYQAGMYINVDALWRTTIARNPDAFLAYSNLGYILESDGKIDEAMNYYRKAIQINPNCYEALDNLGTAFATQGRYEEAVENFKKAIQANPNLPQVLDNLGAVLAAQGQYEEAIQNFRKAIQISPNSYKTLNNLGHALAAQGRYEEAVEDFRRATLIDPSSPDAFLGLGTTLAQSGRNEEAAAQYQEALELNPNLTGALNNLAWILATSPDDELRNGTKAAGLAERACELSHDREPQFLGTLAAAYAEAGRFDDAIAAAQKAVTLAGKNHEPELRQKNADLLELYRAHRPYHEAASPVQTEP